MAVDESVRRGLLIPAAFGGMMLEKAWTRHEDPSKTLAAKFNRL